MTTMVKIWLSETTIVIIRQIASYSEKFTESLVGGGRLFPRT